MKRFLIAGVIMVMTTSLSVAAERTPQGKDEPIIPTSKTMLWNGKDFAGWKLFVPDPSHDVTKTWSTKDGILRCEGLPNG
ncbi:MAG: hypothetical protein MUO33_08220, partial [Sedimentisphaerales bacterium]|nr:hypothetical protein [Sedimentisphaerales bacterium]